FHLAREISVDGAVVRLDPFLDIKRGVEHGLKGVIVLLRDWLELVVVTLGALHRYTQQARGDNLHFRFERVIAIGAYLIRIAVAFARTVLSVPQVVSGLKQFDDLGRGHLPWL